MCETEHVHFIRERGIPVAHVRRFGVFLKGEIEKNEEIARADVTSVVQNEYPLIVFAKHFKKKVKESK